MGSYLAIDTRTIHNYQVKFTRAAHLMMECQVESYESETSPLRKLVNLTLLTLHHLSYDCLQWYYWERKALDLRVSGCSPGEFAS